MTLSKAELDLQKTRAGARAWLRFSPSSFRGSPQG